jgi:accessory gene regulator protein AgrB
MYFLIGALIAVPLAALLLCVFVWADGEYKAKPLVWLRGWRLRWFKRMIALFALIYVPLVLLIEAAIGGYLLAGVWGAIGGAVLAIIVLFLVFCSRSPA